MQGSVTRCFVFKCWMRGGSASFGSVGLAYFNSSGLRGDGG